MPILGCSRPNTYFQGIPIFSDCPMRKSKISSSANPGKRLHHDLLKSQILKVIILQNQQQGMSYIDLLLLLAIIYMMIQKKWAINSALNLRISWWMCPFFLWTSPFLMVTNSTNSYGYPPNSAHILSTLVPLVFYTLFGVINLGSTWICLKIWSQHLMINHHIYPAEMAVGAASDDFKTHKQITWRLPWWSQVRNLDSWFSPIYFYRSYGLSYL